MHSFFDSAVRIVTDFWKSVFPTSDCQPTTAAEQTLSTIPKPSIGEFKPPEPTCVSPNDFKRLKVLGKGTYGKVYQVRRELDGKVFAMKVVTKPTDGSKSRMIRGEREILEKMDSPFLCKMSYFYESAKKRYFVLEFLAGGDLFTILSRNSVLDENATRFYIAEVTLALEHLYNHDVIYRDLKLENVMLDAKGHVKLTDFGFAKFLEKGKRTSTFCGTADYLSPEMVRKAPYDHSVDRWAMGILMYELLVGHTPFLADTDKQRKKNILSGEFSTPSNVSESSLKLIKSLLSVSPKKRPSFPEIKESDFFHTIDWEKMAARGYEPPLTLSLKDETDISQFDRYYTRMYVEESPFKCIDSKAKSRIATFDSASKTARKLFI
uniref:Non-specific serine/threonine protein kinase n=1 Tax=Caenorhabditis tropicalis TaxID=1561998 RepID=A0A1I7UES1_9PELO